MKIPDGWALVPREPTGEMIAAAFDGMGDHDHTYRRSVSVGPYKRMLAAAPPAPTDPEVDAGKEAPGLAGCMYRLLDRCDYRNVERWVRGEIVRGTDHELVQKALAGFVSSAVSQLAGMVTRSQMRLIAQSVMRRAAFLLEDDLKAFEAQKKAAVIRDARIHVIAGEQK